MSDAPEKRASAVGTVTAVLEEKLFRLRLEDGRQVTAHMGAEMRMHEVRLLQGDRVRVELSTFDPSRGRIMSRA